TSFCAQVAEVEVDQDTGQVTVKKIVTAHDVGTILNPLTHQGQIEDGLIQGLGYAMMEELKTEEGQISTLSLGEYKVPTIKDILETAHMFMYIVLYEDHPVRRHGQPLSAPGEGRSRATESHVWPHSPTLTQLYLPSLRHCTATTTASGFKPTSSAMRGMCAVPCCASSVTLGHTCGSSVRASSPTRAPMGARCFASIAMCASHKTSVPTRRTRGHIFATKLAAMPMPLAFICTSNLGECLSPAVCGILTGTPSPRFATPSWRSHSTGSTSSRPRPSAPLAPSAATYSSATRAGMTRSTRSWQT